MPLFYAIFCLCFDMFVSFVVLRCITLYMHIMFVCCKLLKTNDRTIFIKKTIDSIACLMNFFLTFVSSPCVVCVFV